MEAKPLLEIAANSALNKLLTIKSDTEKNDELNRIPFEVKEYLITLINSKISLLNEFKPHEKAKIDQLENLRLSIYENLGKQIPLPPVFEKYPELTEID